MAPSRGDVPFNSVAVDASRRLNECLQYGVWRMKCGVGVQGVPATVRQADCEGSCARLNASHEAAEKYIAQFPSPLLSHGARFVAFIAGSFAALLLGAALVDDQLLERRLGGRTLVW